METYLEIFLEGDRVYIHW